MRLVEFCGTTRIGGVEYSEGERKSFPDDEAAHYIELGWARDPVTGEQGERKPGSNGPIQANKLVQLVGVA